MESSALGLGAVEVGVVEARGWVVAGYVEEEVAPEVPALTTENGQVTDQPVAAVRVGEDLAPGARSRSHMVLQGRRVDESMQF